MARFSPVLWEDDSKQGKFRGILESLEEGLAEFESLSTNLSGSDSINDKNIMAAGKLSDTLLKNAMKLESEFISEAIPVAQIRRASY